jgi:hypothetical protein
MEVKTFMSKLTSGISSILSKIKTIFVKKSEVSEKKEINFKSFKILFITGILSFIVIMIFIPTEQEVEFTAKMATVENAPQKKESDTQATPNQGLATNMWNPGSAKTMGGASGGGSRSQINYNTSMILGSQNGNAKTQLRAGSRIPLRILDKFIVSQESVPILAESILDSTTDSGLRLPMGTRFYGEASFQKGSDRATISFRQISLPNGEIKSIGGMGLGKDGQPGVAGSVYSDGVKNTMGSVITTFVAGYASGSMETDLLGNSKGGVENGIKAAISATAKERAQNFGEKLKTQREWIEVSAGTECDALLSESMNLQQSGGEQ